MCCRGGLRRARAAPGGAAPCIEGVTARSDAPVIRRCDRRSLRPTSSRRPPQSTAADRRPPTGTHGPRRTRTHLGGGRLGDGENGAPRATTHRWDVGFTSVRPCPHVAFVPMSPSVHRRRAVFDRHHRRAPTASPGRPEGEGVMTLTRRQILTGGAAGVGLAVAGTMPSLATTERRTIRQAPVPPAAGRSGGRPRTSVCESWTSCCWSISSRGGTMPKRQRSSGLRWPRWSSRGAHGATTRSGWVPS
jgi:hypothetical protein